MKNEERRVTRKGTTKYLKPAPPSVSHSDNPMKKKLNERTNEQEKVGAGRSCERGPDVGGRLEDEPMNDLGYKREKRILARKFTTLNKLHDSAHANLTGLGSGMMASGPSSQAGTDSCSRNQPDVAWCEFKGKREKKET